MAPEDRQLLLKDLCARLPHHCRVFYEYVDDLDNKTYGYSLTLNTWCINELDANKAVVKPYLRPMSSMTVKEIETYRCLNDALDENYEVHIDHAYPAFDWLNANHFDYRGLIKKGLAIEVTKENNPYE